MLFGVGSNCWLHIDLHERNLKHLQSYKCSSSIQRRSTPNLCALHAYEHANAALCSYVDGIVVHVGGYVTRQICTHLAWHDSCSLLWCRSSVTFTFGLIHHPTLPFNEFPFRWHSRQSTLESTTKSWWNCFSGFYKPGAWSCSTFWLISCQFRNSHEEETS